MEQAHQQHRERSREERRRARNPRPGSGRKSYRATLSPLRPLPPKSPVETTLSIEIQVVEISRRERGGSAFGTQQESLRFLYITKGFEDS